MPHLSRLEAPTASSPARKVPPGVLSGPITSTMFRLALPTIAVLVVQTFVGVAETYFVSSLGTDVLAGVTLVFPVLMLMQMMSNGGVGGGRLGGSAGPGSQSPRGCRCFGLALDRPRLRIRHRLHGSGSSWWPGSLSSNEW